MGRIRGVVLVFFAGLTAACCLWKPPADPNHVLVAENAFGKLPKGAHEVGNRAFLREVSEDKLRVLSPQRDREAELAQFQSDVQALQAIPEDERSPDVRSILSAVADGVDPLVEPTTATTGADGKPKAFLLLGLAVRAHAAVEAERLARDPRNSLAAYRLAFAAAPPSARHDVPTPDSLANSPLADVEAARARLGAALSLVPDLGEVRVEGPSAPVPVAPEAVTPTPTDCGVGVIGNDGPGDCARAASGLYRRYWWPLKRFVTPIRDQSRRGLCWAFAAVAALESRELVVRGETRNLSEQFFAYRWKSTLSLSSGEGDHAELALGFLDGFVGAASAIPNEKFWRYNPACSRPQKPEEFTYDFDCKSYIGNCSATVSEGPLDCTQPGSIPGVVCGVKKFDVEPGAGVPSMQTVQVWKSGQTLDLGSLRAVLANGQPILASFNVYRGFQSAANGFVTDYAQITNDGTKAGAHQILFTGFVSNEDLLGVLPVEKVALGGGYFIAKNSWGCTGDGGYYYIPVLYVKHYFSRLSVPQIPADRSSAWNTAKTAAAQPPKVQITLPFVSTDVALSPHRVDFAHDVNLAAIANDVQDGAGCCADTFIWQVIGRANLGNTTVLPATVLSGTKEARLELTARDSDGNSGHATLWLADIEPRIEVVRPLPEQTYFTGNPPQTFEGRVVAEGVPDLDCSALTWHTSFGGDPTVTGCTPSLTFNFPGDRDLLVDWADANHEAHAKVPIHVVPPSNSGPPNVALALVGPPEKGDARVRFTLTDPGGPGEASLGQYKLAWQLEHGGVVRQITPGQLPNLANEVLIHSRVELGVDCGPPRQVLVRLTVTDPEGLTGSGTTTFTDVLPACIN